MGYERLGTRLASGLDCRDVLALPDGSVDQYYAVSDAAGDRIRTREAFVDRLAGDGVRSLRLTPGEIRPGGEAVNAAEQVHALGQWVHLYGHLDDPELGPFPFPTTSMGAPATVNVLAFETAELMLSVESPDIRDWTVDDLFDAAGVAPDELVDDAVVVVQNWVGFPEMTDALRALAGVDLGPGPIVFDPGDISGAPADPLRALCAALGRLDETTDVVLTANDGELARLAAVLGVQATGTDRDARLRADLGVSAVVRHAEPSAVAATGEVTVVENFDADRVVRRTGAGDRFDGALATALAADLPWDDALALGNACATHFVETGETATAEDVVAMVESRAPDD
jgi:sugar/nucleoside kinase (ribokinase family)